MNPAEQYRERLKTDGWSESFVPFWRDDDPCFYDLTLTKTVLLFLDQNGQVIADHFFWKFESQELPDYINVAHVEVRRYELHHSMNALQWHDYGDRKIVH